jgi:branched-chain amino acid transport system ATP-binding protein
MKTLLSVQGIDTYYGSSHILFGVTINIGEGQAIALLGRNGAGKTTTFRSIMGLTKPKEGRIIFDGTDITHMDTHRIARMRIGYVPEDRQIFTDLTVRENLDLGINPKHPGRFDIHTACEIFPVLDTMLDRPAKMMSGGEQQMLSIARTLMVDPRLLLLDEPLEGLSPLVVKELGSRIKDLKKHGITILLSEQNIKFAADLCDKVYLIDKGTIRYEGPVEEFKSDEEIQEKYLHVSSSRHKLRHS